MKTFNCTAVKSALVGMGILFASISQAYVVETCSGNENKRHHWPKPKDTNHPSPSATAKFNLSSVFGENSTAGLEVAQDRWNSTPAAIYIDINKGDTSIGYNNNQSEIWWSSELSERSKTFKRVACGLHATGAIYEADIVFGHGYVDSFYRGETKSNLIPYGGTKTSFINAAMQEFGNAIGLGFVNGYYSLMNNSAINAHFQTNGDYARSYVGEDTIDGALDIYGSRYMWTSRNVGATHWKYDAETEKHKKTAVYNQFQEILPTKAVNGEGHFKVTRGQTHLVEFTYENLTYYDATVDVGIYISSNDNITRNDRLLKVVNDVQLVMNKPTTTKTSIVIPADLEGDKAYYVGAIVNYNFELVHSNNSDDDAAYLPIFTD